MDHSRHHYRSAVSIDLRNANRLRSSPFPRTRFHPNFHQNALSNFASFLSAPPPSKLQRKFYQRSRSWNTFVSIFVLQRIEIRIKRRPSKKKKQEDDDNDDDDDDDGSRPTIHVNEKKKRKKGTTIKVKPGRAEMHGAFSSRATGDAVTSVNKQMDKRRGPPNWTLKEGARKRFERGHGFKARRPKRGCVLIRADR